MSKESEKRKTVFVNYVSKRNMISIENLVRELPHHGVNVVAIVSKNMENIDVWEAIDGVTTIQIDGYTTVKSFPFKTIKYFFKERKKIKKALLEYKPEVSFIPINTYWAWFIDKSLKSTKLIYMMHDPINHNWKNFYMRFTNYKLARRSTRIILLSKLFIDYVKEHFRINDNAIDTLQFGTENMSPDNSRKSIVDYSDDKVNFVFQGQIEVYKGLDVLARAYKKLYDECPNISLTIAGKGDFSRYESLYSELKNCTIINRWLSDEEVSGLFNDRNVITVLPYITATQSGVINVAMPGGSPIIATNCGGIPEQIEDGVTGFLVEPNNVEELYKKMLYVVRNMDKMDYIRENAYKRMDNLSWDKIAEQLVKSF